MITTSPTSVRTGGLIGRVDVAAAAADVAGDAADARSAGRAAAAILTLLMISRRSEARLTGAPGVYFKMKSTAPSSRARSVVDAARRVTPLITTTDTDGVSPS